MSLAEQLQYGPERGSPSGSAILACIDRADEAASIMPHAFALAEALDAPLTLLQVLETRAPSEVKPDPIEWDLRRHEARRALRRLAEAQSAASPRASLALAEGHPADEISRVASEQEGSLVVLGTSGWNGMPHYISGTVHNVLSRVTAPILLVPSCARLAPASYRRIVVPLDGSCWAESVLPMAARLAKAADAELLLAHVVPNPELTEIRPLEPEDLLLRQHVVERNEATARGYLARIRTNLEAMGLRVRVCSTRGDDVRSALAQLIQSEAADLVVLSARGQGANHHHQMRYGSVASFLMSHCTVPMLILQSEARAPAAGMTEDHALRLPVACLG